MIPRIMMVLHQFNPRPDNVGLQAERLGGKLAGLRHQVNVLTRRTNLHSVQQETLRGMTIHRRDFTLPIYTDGPGAGQFRFLINQRNQFDIVQSHRALGHAMVSTMAALWLQKKSIITVTSQGPYGDLATMAQSGNFEDGLAILHQAHAVIAVSSNIERELLDHGFRSDSIRRIPNGVDIHDFHRREPLKEEKNVRFLFAGRRSLGRGFDTVLEAMRILADGPVGHRIELSLWGDDAPGKDYKRRCKDLGITSKVTFNGFAQRMPAVYASVGALVLPSRSIGLSNALLEAMAFELPVIASGVSGSADLITDGENGLLVPPDSPEALAAAMERIVNNQSEAISFGKNARKTVVKRCALNDVAGRYQALYQELTNHG